MNVIGCDYHPGFQQIAWLDTQTAGGRGAPTRAPRGRKVRGMGVRGDMEASGHARWFERLLADLQFEL
jgi:transposase